MRRDKQEAQAQFNRRSLLLSGLGAGAFAALGARMYGLQVLAPDAYRLLSRLIDPQAQVRREADGLFVIRRGDATQISVAWGPAARTLRDQARGQGADILCLAEPGRGLLAADPGRCKADAMTLSGSGLNAILSP